MVDESGGICSARVGADPPSPCVWSGSFPLCIWCSGVWSRACLSVAAQVTDDEECGPPPGTTVFLCAPSPATPTMLSEPRRTDDQECGPPPGATAPRRLHRTPRRLRSMSRASRTTESTGRLQALLPSTLCVRPKQRTNMVDHVYPGRGNRTRPAIAIAISLSFCCFFVVGLNLFLEHAWESCSFR